jgi:sugar lactone lactonase YvrE
MAFDGAGNLYVTNQNDGTIHKFSPTGADLGTFATGSGAPDGLAIDSAGNVYQSRYLDGTIHKYSPTGADLGTFTSGIDGPYYLAFGPSPVPEPGGLTLMGLGLAGLFGYRWLRRRATAA